MSSSAGPQFALIRIPPRTDVVQLFQLLVSNGFTEVSFVNALRDDAFLPAIVDPPRLPEATAQYLELPSQEAFKSPSQEIVARREDPILISNQTRQTKIKIEEPAGDCHSSSSSPPQAISINSSYPRQRGCRATAADDPTVYAVCQLCHNKIMSSRLSNLTNHVRRHAQLKQFKCSCCDYTHNEMAKVRLHMQHNHRDRKSHPIDQLNSEMQTQWDRLMDHCFPGYNKEVKSVAELDQNFTCIECGELIAGGDLVAHLEQQHAVDCIPYACEKCGYESCDQWKVRLHISVKHADEAADVAVRQLETASNLAAFVNKFFPDFPSDSDEQELLATIQKVGSPMQHRKLDCELTQSDGNDGSESNFSTSPVMHCKAVPRRRPISALLNHAKRHCHLKQFQCTRCSYASSEAAHVRSHLHLKHACADQPLDHRNEALQAAWMNVIARCFPHVTSRLKKFRFKKESKTTVAACELPLSGENSDASGSDVRRSRAARRSVACSHCSFHAVNRQQLHIHAILKHHHKLPPTIRKPSTRSSNFD